MPSAGIVTTLTLNSPESETCFDTEKTSKTNMATKKKTAKKSTSAKPAKAASSLTHEQMRDLSPDTDVELTIRGKVEYTYTEHMEVLDSDGDNLSILYADITHARIVPKAKVKVIGEGADRAAQILRDKGFDVD